MTTTVTCQCGKRLTVGPHAGQDTVACPECGADVPLNGAGDKPAGLSFGVKRVDERRRSFGRKSEKVEFFCPGCGRQFHQAAQAAGKQTRCPKCETEFTIPGNSAGRVSNPSVIEEKLPSSAKDGLETRPAGSKSAEASVAAAVAAYNAGRSQSSGRRGRLLIPIGLLLLVLGGAVSITGNFLMVKGYMTAFGLEDLLAGGGLNVNSGLLKPFADHNNLLQDLLNDIDNPRGGRRQPPQQPRGQSQPAKDLLNKQLAKLGGGEGKSLDEQLKEREEKRARGQSLLLWGVISSGVGKLLGFIGGIFLLAGLICRVLRPQQSVVLAPAEAQPSRSS